MIFPTTELAQRAFRELSDAADYFWKSYGLLEHELKIEAKKVGLINYRDSTATTELPKRSTMRWQAERYKIEHTFSYLIANGNLFSATSLFETYAVFLCREVEIWSKKKLREQRGNGIERCFNFLRSNGINPAQASHFNEVNALIKIRNCLYHANGLTEFSREKIAVERIIQGKLYLQPRLRARVAESGAFDPIAKIVTQPIGQQLQVNEYFSWYAVCAYRDFFCDLCRHADDYAKAANR